MSIFKGKPENGPVQHTTLSESMEERTVRDPAWRGLVRCHFMEFFSSFSSHLCWPLPSIAIHCCRHCRPLPSALPSIAVHCRRQSTAMATRDTQKKTKKVSMKTHLEGPMPVIVSIVQLCIGRNSCTGTWIGNRQ